MKPTVVGRMDEVVHREAPGVRRAAMKPAVVDRMDAARGGPSSHNVVRLFAVRAQAHFGDESGQRKCEGSRAVLPRRVGIFLCGLVK